MKITLEKGGYKVTGIFTSAEEALEFIKVNKSILVISNVKLRGKMTGIDLVKELQDRYSIPLLLISGGMINHSTNKYDKVKCHYIEKPVSGKELLEKVESILSQGNSINS